MVIDNHKYVGASEIHSVSTYGTLVPSYIAIHFSLGGSVSGSVSHLNEKGFGYNIIVDRDGSIYQTAPFNRIVRHAGASNWRGWDNLNSFSIGICLANYGPCTSKNGKFYNVYDQEMKPASVQSGSHYNGQKKYQDIFWEKYPSPQLRSAEAVVQALVDFYQIRDVVRHDDVAIARKIDTGPALDMTPFHDIVGDRSGEKIYKFRVVVPAGDTLTLRRSYTVASDPIGSFANGTELYVHSFAYRKYNGILVKSKWCAVSRNGFDRIGFVSRDYLEAVGHFS
jgi:N-acetylmuramoyl-L-alanine amidase